MNQPADKTINQLNAASLPSNSDELVLWQGNETKRLTMAQLEAKIAQGVPNPPSLPPFCKMHATSNLNLPTPAGLVTWQAANGTEPSLWDSVGKQVMTVPTGTTYIRLTANIWFSNGSQTGSFFAHFSDQGGSAVLGAIISEVNGASSLGLRACNLSSGPLAVTAGNAFGLKLNISNPAYSPAMGGSLNFMTMELLN